MLKNNFYYPHELEEYPQLKIYIDTIYKKSLFPENQIEISQFGEEDYFQMIICLNGKMNEIRSKVCHYDDIGFSIAFDGKFKFIEGEIWFNHKKYSSSNQNEFNGMCDKFVKWSNNLYGLLNRMLLNMK